MQRHTLTFLAGLLLPGLLLAASPAAAAGCQGVSLEGTVRGAKGETGVTFVFDTRTARVGGEGEGGRSLTIRHETCTDATISFDLEDAAAPAGTCMLYLDGSRAIGDCRVGMRRDVAISAIVERTPAETTGAVVPPEAATSGN